MAVTTSDLYIIPKTAANQLDEFKPIPDLNNAMLPPHSESLFYYARSLNTGPMTPIQLHAGDGFNLRLRLDQVQWKVRPFRAEVVSLLAGFLQPQSSLKLSATPFDKSPLRQTGSIYNVIDEDRAPLPFDSDLTFTSETLYVSTDTPSKKGTITTELLVYGLLNLYHDNGNKEPYTLPFNQDPQMVISWGDIGGGP